MTSKKSVQGYLKDMLEYLEKISRFTENGYDAFSTDDKTQLAVIRAYEVIGEIVKRLPGDFRADNSQIDWRKLAGFRDFLSHNYDEILLAFVWNAVEDLPDLHVKVQTLLDKQPPESDETA